jgi:hypothetical protein
VISTLAVNYSIIPEEYSCADYLLSSEMAKSVMQVRRMSDNAEGIFPLFLISNMLAEAFQ